MKSEPTMRRSVPVTIIAGFLGAGKTTLLSRMLREATETRYGVLVNDFAEINIDVALIGDAGPDRIALTNGCVCCTIRDDLLAAALELIRRDVYLDQILIECSGVSDPLAVARTLTSELACAAFRIDAILTIIDAANVLDLGFDETEQVIDQAASSDLVLVNKCDIAGSATVEEIERMLLEAQPSMRIVRTSHVDVPFSMIAGPRSEPCMSGHGAHSHLHVHSDTYWTRSWQVDHPLSRDAFEATIRALPARVYRAKGILSFVEQPNHQAVFHLVGKRADLTFEPARQTASSNILVAIGRGAELDTTAIDRLFQPHPERTLHRHDELVVGDLQ